MDFHDYYDEEPVSSQRASRGTSRGRRPRRGRSASTTRAGSWRDANNVAGYPQQQQHVQAVPRRGTNLNGPASNRRLNTRNNANNAAAQPIHSTMFGSQQHSQREEAGYGGNRMRNQRAFPIHKKYGNTHDLARQTRSMSQLNINLPDEDGPSGHPVSKGKHIGFKFLLELSKMDSKQIIVSINEKKDAFLQLLQSSIERPDLYVLIMKVITIACNSTFEQLKSNLMLNICNSQFVNNLRNYLMDLPYTQKKSLNSMYWGKPDEFWENFICFCEYIINTFPSIALNKCRSLIEGTSKCCLEGLRERHGFNLSKVQAEKLEHLRERLTIQEEECKTVLEQRKTVSHDTENNPPENFRLLSILPTRDDLLDRRPYLRPNIINGGYVDTEHYLDVQFRLLREDCFGPLRDGIHQYIEDPNRRKFDNIRIFRNVKFVHPYASRQKLGSVVEVDEYARKRFKRINWAHSKRFIFGSLILFTKDNCRNFIIATILDRDIKLLTEGKIPISIVEDNGILPDDMYKSEEFYLMIESEVYFEPYFHILRALQDPKFPQDLAMSKYIVKVDPQPQHPAYLTETTEYAIKTKTSRAFKFTVLNEDTWPSDEAMGLNESQYQAYRLALTHEFSVIQGPPGTGKTFLGVKVARTLLQNRTASNRCILLICYTNHALDQFLENIIPITNSIARIGGQSRNPSMEQFNLNTLRRNGPKIKHNTNKLFFEQRSVLRRSIVELKVAQEQIDTINDGVLSFKCIQKHIPESYALAGCYKDKKDPLACWLFENMTYSFDDGLLNEVEYQHENNAIDEDIYMRDDVILDDFDGDEDELGIVEVSSSFSLNKTKTKLQMLLSYYRKSKDSNEKQNLYTEMVVLYSRIKMFQEMSALRNHKQVINFNLIHPAQCATADRWIIYFRWTERVMLQVKEQVKPLRDALQEANTAYEEIRMMMDLEVLRDIKVVGMTTSGASRLRKLLQELAPPIVIVEEAAEVLEQHIVASLTKDCRHLILIGDHQQLRPSAAHMRLAKHFNLEVSLFERMIVNAVHSRRLDVQHRMRPEIAALIAPHVYRDLRNHPSVLDFPPVLGVCHNLFFFTHDFKEEEVQDSSSKANHKEADMVLHLANYLMQQGYAPGDITVLAAYSGQMFYMRKEREKYAHLSKVKITVVDNYQGEESRIILLSLVRNNSQDNIGFLKVENRVCVALSRAREGFYMFGNIDLLKNNSDLWLKISETLANNGSLGTSLRLKCEIHADQITTVATTADFQKVPEGGCLLKCNFNLPDCNHQCPLICHGYDREHKLIKCPLKCERVICKLKHVCPLKCALRCAPCSVPVLKGLPCGHAAHLPCSLEPADRSVKCEVRVDVTLPHCNHETNKPCYMDVRYVACPVSCDARLACGHVCGLKCHVTRDPEHKRYICKKSCPKSKKGCSVQQEGDLGAHKCRNKCYEQCDDCEVEVVKKRSGCKHSERVKCNQDVNETLCRKNCARTLPCGHFCKKKCFEPCGDCRQRVVKEIEECGHEAAVTCGEVPQRAACERRCERALPCGHACLGRCAAPCDPAACAERMPAEFDSPCGHKVTLPCNAYRAALEGTLSAEQLVASCEAACGATLACGHACAGSCARCHRGRLHAPCAQTCHQTLICGHQCLEPCNQICPPCAKPCEVKCAHSKCKRLCGQPCVFCEEACSRRCEHGACSRRCGEACDAAPCAQPCACALPCKHRCRGLCGEPCPPVCRKCDPDHFPKDFLGDDFEDDAKFILLQDCNHVLELSDMDHLMFGDKDTVAIRSCPFCRKPIINTHRYKDFVNDMFKKEINPIKEKVYGTEVQIKEKKIELKAKIEEMTAKGPKILLDKLWLIRDWGKAFNKVVTKKGKKPSLLDIEMEFIYLNILEMLSDTYDIYIAANLTEFKEVIVKQVNLICNTLMNNIQKISQQQQKDIGVEIKRMNSIIQLAKMTSHEYYKNLKDLPKVKEAVKSAKAVVTGWGAYDENKGIVALKVLQEAIKVSGVVSKQERELIVRAIGLKAGHWYKCPNGHFYCIGECGGAMQRAKCIECGVDIGGERHTLLATNRHAPEMDGSKFAAWSEEYNNMANFNFD